MQLPMVQVSFGETSGSLAIPFMTMTLSAAGFVRNWATSTVEGNNIKGYHSTGWVSINYKSKVLAVRGADPALRLQIWSAIR